MEVLFATAKRRRSCTSDFISNITCWCVAVVQVLCAVLFDTISPSSMSIVKSHRDFGSVRSAYSSNTWHLHDRLHLLFFSHSCLAQCKLIFYLLNYFSTVLWVFSSLSSWYLKNSILLKSVSLIMGVKKHSLSRYHLLQSHISYI